MFTKEEIIARRKAEIAQAQAEGLEPPKAGLNLALLIMSSALYRQRQWSGTDYAEHPVTVGMNKTRSETKRIIGVLHDVVEDSDWTLDDLRSCGFSERIVAGVDSVTKRDGEKYLDFIERCSHNPDGIDIKINDLEHNSTVSRNPSLLTDRNIEKLNLYIISYQYLTAVKKGKIEPGTKMSVFLAGRPDLCSNPALLARHSTNCAAGNRALPFPGAPRP